MQYEIDRKQMVTLGDLPQKIHIRTRDAKKPVLLFLHGGPGVTNRHTIIHHHEDLTDTFTIVAWDQRGTGGSYFGAKRETLTVDRLVEDANELVLWLCREFKKEKIFIIGGSWGSELGTYLAHRRPEHIAAYVGFGQVVNGEQNEAISYAFALREAEKAGDVKAIETLRRVGPPVMGVYKGGLSGLMAQRNIMMKYGGYSKATDKRSYFSSMIVPMVRSGEYSLKDFIGAAKGYRFVLDAMWPEVGETDFPKTCTKFEVPYFVFDGRLDQNTPSELVEDWFQRIEAPEKMLVWFENSGHNPMNDEGAQFKKLLRERLLAVAEREGSNV